MIRILLISIFSFLTLLPNWQAGSLNAQTDEEGADIYWGKELKEPNGSYLSKIIGTDGKGFFAMREKVPTTLNANNPKIFVEYYNNKMDLKKAKDLSLKYKGKIRKFEDFFKFDNYLYLLTSFHNERKEMNYLFVQSVSTRSLLPRNDLKMIAQIETRGISKQGAFDVEISKDSSKVLIYSQLPNKKGSPERFALQVYDNEFNELWTKDITLPYNDNRYSVEEYQIDNQGNVYLVGVIYQDRIRTRRQGLPTYQYNVLTYTQGGGEAEEYKINIGEKFVTDLTLRPDNKGELVAAGFFSEKSSYSIKGTFFFRLDPIAKEMKNKNLREFEFEFLTEFMSQGQANRARRREEKGNGPELYRYSLDDLILRNDGGAVLVAEQYYVQEILRDRYTNGGFYGGRYSGFGFPNNGVNNRVDRYYNYNDIIVVNINGEGEIEWTTRIPKRQETYNDGGYFSSYSMSIVKDKLYFIFNDNSRNFDPRKNQNRLYEFNGQYSVIAVTEVATDGSASTYPLFSNRDANVLTRPKICKQIGRRSMIVYGERGRRYRFANVRFND